MAARSKARRRVLDLLFEAEARGVGPMDVMAEYEARRASGGRQPFNPYVAEAVAGVQAHLAEIDERVSTAAIGWTLDRMPAVDRNALRIAVWEIWFRPDVPDKVAVAEAVAAVRELSTDESPTFVNGVLASIMADHVRAAGSTEQ